MDSTDDMARYGESVLRSERLRLRPLEEQEIERLEAWWDDPATMGLQTASVLPRPSGSRRELFRSWHSNEDAAGVGFGVERVEDGELIGSVVLYGTTYLTQTATFAIILAPEASGQGYGTEATRLMVDYGFRSLPLHRIELSAWAFNTRALAAYERAGFLVEGRRRQVVFADGAWHDQVLMAVLRQDWEASR